MTKSQLMHFAFTAALFDRRLQMGRAASRKQCPAISVSKKQQPPNPNDENTHCHDTPLFDHFAAAGGHRRRAGRPGHLARS
jgi:hypothetical protein